MHMSLFTVLFCALVLAAWIAIWLRYRHSERRRRARQAVGATDAVLPGSGLGARPDLVRPVAERLAQESAMPLSRRAWNPVRSP